MPHKSFSLYQFYRHTRFHAFITASLLLTCQISLAAPMDGGGIPTNRLLLFFPLAAVILLVIALTVTRKKNPRNKKK